MRACESPTQPARRYNNKHHMENIIVEVCVSIGVCTPSTPMPPPAAQISVYNTSTHTRAPPPSTSCSPSTRAIVAVVPLCFASQRLRALLVTRPCVSSNARLSTCARVRACVYNYIYAVYTCARPCVFSNTRLFKPHGTGRL